MGTVVVVIAGISLVVSVAVKIVIDKYNECRILKQLIEEYIRIIDGIQRANEQYRRSYLLEDCDKRIIDECRRYISERLGNNIKGTFERCATMDAKMQLATEVARGLAKCMDVDVASIEFKCLDEFTYGLADRDEGVIRIILNESLLIADPVQLVKTTCHELRHHLQYQTITNNKWGFSEQRVAQWIYSFDDYIICVGEEDYAGYSTQIIEEDANKFANEVLKNLEI